MKTILTTLFCSILLVISTNAQTVGLSLSDGNGGCSLAQTLTITGSANGGRIYESATFRIIYTGTRWEIRIPNTTGGFYNNSTQLPNPPCSSDGGWVTITGGNSCFTHLISLNGDGCGNAIPVELMSFEAFQKEQTVKLKWQTASEINNDYFEIQRSSDGEIFETIATMEGNGNSIESMDYEYIDKDISNSRYYYRLKQVDFDGTSEIHKTVVVEIKYLEIITKIYPTITKGEINIQTSENEITVLIYSTNGQLMKSFANPKEQIDISELPNGSYWLKIIGKGNTQNQMVLKY